MEQTFFIAHRLRQVEDMMTRSNTKMTTIIEKYMN